MSEKNISMHVEGLSVRLGERYLLKEVGFKLNSGDVLGLIGETGSGKTVLIDAIGRNTASGLSMEAEKLDYMTDGQTIDMLKLKEDELGDAIWGKKLTFILSNARSRFSPIMTVGEQFINILKSNTNMTSQEAEKKAREMFSLVQMPDPAQNMRNYPHELSGGMIQRVEIAIALAMNPKFLLADEPTMGLDVTVQRQILDLMDGLFKKMDSTVILATRDLGIAANYCNKIAVLHNGNIVEFGDVKSFFANPRHPYSRYLLKIAFVANDKDPKFGQKVYRSEKDTEKKGCFCSGSCERIQEECLKKIPDLCRFPDGSFVRCSQYECGRDEHGCFEN